MCLDVFEPVGAATWSGSPWRVGGCWRSRATCGKGAAARRRLSAADLRGRASRPQGCPRRTAVACARRRGRIGRASTSRPLSGRRELQGSGWSPSLSRSFDAPRCPLSSGWTCCAFRALNFPPSPGRRSWGLRRKGSALRQQAHPLLRGGDPPLRA